MIEKMKERINEDIMTVENATFEATRVNSTSRSSPELNSGTMSSFNIMRPSGRLFHIFILLIENK